MSKRFTCCGIVIAFVAMPIWAPTSRADAASPSDSSLEEITVTAQRRQENNQNVPIAITALSAQTLANSGVNSTVDLEFLTSGLVMTRQTAGTTPYLRGIGTPAVSAGIESPIATYVDGVYYPAAAGNVLSLNNVDSVQVLKGPQGTLFGRNATGGLMSITTRTPQVDPSVEGSISYGDYQTLETSLYATGGTGNVAADFALYELNQAQGYGNNLVTGDQVNRNRGTALRSKLVWSLSDNDHITIGVDYSRSLSDIGLVYTAYPGSILLNGQSRVGGPYDSNGDFQDGQHTDAFGGSVKYEHEFDWATFSSLTAYHRFITHYVSDIDGTPFPILNFITNQFDTSGQQEFLLVGHASRVEWTGGVFLFFDKAGFNPLAITSEAIPSLNYGQLSFDRTYSYASFSQATWAATDTTNVTGGLRYTSDRRLFSGAEDAVAGNPVPLGSALIPAFKTSATFDKPTWRFAVDQKITPDILTYFSYDRGFKSGVFNSTPPTAIPVKPETLDAYEIGLKSEWLDRQLRVNAAVFHYKYDDVQLSKVAGNGTQELLNAANAVVTGLDLDFVIAPHVSFGKLLFTGGASWLPDAKYTSFPNGPTSTPTGAGGNTEGEEDLADKRMIHAPKYTTYLGSELTVPVSVGEVGFNMNYFRNGGFFWEPDNRLRQNAYNVLNAQLSYAFGHSNSSRIRFWGKNLTNSVYGNFIFSSGLADLASYAPPRTYGVAYDFKY